ncbi:hypothetical protein P8452_57838 [Trifolium repens]|nr:hypothetical protein P8452_57834 [Trifolium repens]WJX74148.1 hypothetical protein P8452_57838 [Trifolium repens]
MNEFHDVAPKLETLSAYGVHPFTTRHVIGHLALVLTSTREIVKNTMNEFHDVAPKLETLSAYGVHPFTTSNTTNHQLSTDFIPCF